MQKVYINRIETAVPAFDIHKKFVDFAPRLLKDSHAQKLFRVMAQKSQIEHRYSFLEPHDDESFIDTEHFYQNGRFPDTKTRMQRYEMLAFTLAQRAIDKLQIPKDITHVIVTSCTGFYAPGLDIDIVRHYGLSAGVERTIIGFMGCYAAFNALKLSRHIVRSNPAAKVLIVNLELCSLHLQETDVLEEMLSFLIFSDGCAASLITADPSGIEMCGFQSTIVPESADEITWRIGQNGFDMFLSGKIPRTVKDALKTGASSFSQNLKAQDIKYWAIHPGGRSILDAVQSSLQLTEADLIYSRDILRRFGNMSSATVMFVLKEIEQASGSGLGCALAFGPGITTESMIFRKIA